MVTSLILKKARLNKGYRQSVPSPQLGGKRLAPVLPTVGIP